MGNTLGPFNLILLAIPGVALKIAVRIMYGRRSYTAADPLKVLLTVASTKLLVLAALGALFGVVGIPTSLPAALIIWLPIVVVIIIVALMAIDRYRHSEHRALVWALSAAAQRGVPLPEAARAFADEIQGDTGIRALNLARALEQGLPLSLATRQARLRLSTPMRVAVRVGEALGMLGPAMKQQLEDSADAEAVLRPGIVRFINLIVAIFVGIVVLTFVMLKIMPVFQKMFQEFGLKLPRPTILLIDTCNWFVQYGWFMTAPLTILLNLAALALVIFGILYFVGWVPRDLPLVWRLFKRYDGALVMRGLALSVRRDVPLAEGLKLLAAAYPIRHIARQLDAATAKVQQGIDWRDSLRKAGLISAADAAVLASAERAGNLAWALEEMADSALRRQAYRLQWVVQIVFPIAVLLAGFFVAFFVIGLFLPLISLIQGLA